MAKSSFALVSMAGCLFAVCAGCSSSGTGGGSGGAAGAGATTGSGGASSGGGAGGAGAGGTSTGGIGGGGIGGGGGTGGVGGTSGTGGSGGSIPAGACSNPGGLFGDYVVNGGYRCAPGAMPVYEIQVCTDGSWGTAATCSCEVTSGGSKYPSQCFDIDFANVARCEYGADYCYECDPSAGCQSF